MANTFKVHNAALGTTADTAVYTCPAATTAVVILCQVTNIDGSNAGILNMTHYDSSTTTQRHLASTISIPSDSCLLYTSPSPRDYAASRMPSSA